MLSNELIIDAFKRIKDVVHRTVEGLNIDDLTYQPNETANSISWLVWHLTRIQDDHIAALMSQGQVWTNGWYEKFTLPFDVSETGYGHTAEDVTVVRASSALLTGYLDEVYEQTVKYVKGLTSSDYKKIVDERWDPPVSLTVRLISVISDDLQHAGQAAYVRGIIKKS
jgi:hypothetical protein